MNRNKFCLNMFNNVGGRRFSVMSTCSVFAAILIFLVSLCCIDGVGEAAQIKGDTIYLSKSDIKYTLDFETNNISEQKATQNFYVDGDKIFTSQRVERDDNYVKISLFRVSGGNAKLEKEMWIRDAGHGQTLEVYKYGKEYYILFSLKSNEKVKDKHWSLEIGRIQFKENDITSAVSYSSFDRLTDLDYANYYGYKDKQGFGAVLRTDAAVSSDGKTLLIWKQNQQKKNEFSGWSFDEINKRWDANGVQVISFKKTNPNDLGRKFDFCDKIEDLKLPKTFQGIEISDKGDNGKYSIYIVKGNEGDNNPNMIYRFTSDGRIKAKRTIVRNGVFTKKMEIEGIHIASKKLLFLMV